MVHALKFACAVATMVVIGSGAAQAQARLPTPVDPGVVANVVKKTPSVTGGIGSGVAKLPGTGPSAPITAGWYYYWPKHCTWQPINGNYYQIIWNSDGTIAYAYSSSSAGTSLGLIFNNICARNGAYTLYLDSSGNIVVAQTSL